MARVVVCDSHSAIQKALEVTIAESESLELAGMTSSVDKLPDLVSGTGADVLVLELTLPGAVGLDLIRELKRRFEHLRIVVYTMYDEAIYAARAIRAGASGYVMKREDTAKVIDATRSALRGEFFVSDEIAAQLAHGTKSGRSRTILHPTNVLSDEEMAVFQLVGEGVSLEDAAQKLGVTKARASELLRAATDRIGLSSAESLVQYASRIVHQ